MENEINRIKTGKIAGKKGGKRTKELGVGLFSLTKEQRQEHASKMGKLTYELGTGIHGIELERKKEISRKTASQKWMCLETGFITNAGNLAKYQKARGIDTSKRVRIS
jgi:hypothetical protein